MKEDLTGQKFGRLTVLNKAEDAIEKSGKHRTQYNCICDCGNTKIVKAKYLKNGDVRSCGCLHKEQLHDRLFEDLTGQKFGRLTVIEQAESKVGLTKWKCQCECGNISIVRANALKNGSIKSCGCLRREVASQTGFVDLTGRRFGMLLVINQTESTSVGNRQTPKLVWHCKCDCGNEVDVIGENLKSGTTTSCGCRLIPRLEQYVLQYFDELGLQRDIDYCTQKKFDDLRGLNGYPLSYDFAIYDNNNIKYLVECQGVQHYQPVGLFGGKEQFEIQQFHDELKAEYAKSNGYELIEIPYTIRVYDELKDLFDSLELKF